MGRNRSKQTIRSKPKLHEQERKLTSHVRLFSSFVRSFVRSFVNFPKTINKQRLLIPALVKLMLNKEHHKKMLNRTKANMGRDFKRQSLRDTLLVTFSGDREKAAIWRLDECEVGG